LGDAKHYPFNPPLVSDKITIRIKSVWFGYGSHCSGFERTSPRGGLPEGL